MIGKKPHPMPTHAPPGRTGRGLDRHLTQIVIDFVTVTGQILIAVHSKSREFDYAPWKVDSNSGALAGPVGWRRGRASRCVSASASAHLARVCTQMGHWRIVHLRSLSPGVIGSPVVSSHLPRASARNAATQTMRRGDETTARTSL